MKALGAGPNPDSIILTPEGREVQLKVHRCQWSGAYPENSLPAIEECCREAVARVEIDLHMLRDAEFLVLHDPVVDDLTTGSGPVGDLTAGESQALHLRFQRRVSAERPPLFGEVVALIRGQQYPRLMELDLPDFRPLPWTRAEELVRLVEPVKDRVVFNGADWNMRRLLKIDPALPMSYDPNPYLDWLPEGDPEEEEHVLPRGAYGYLDAHPLARTRLTPVREYLEDRLGGIGRLVPGALEAHVRLIFFERMLDDGVADAAELFHRTGTLVDVWTLNAGTPRWRERLARALAAGADVVTTDTPHALAAAGREGVGA